MGVRRLPYEIRWVAPGVAVTCRGLVGGLPAVSWGWAPVERCGLATRRQLRALGLRPGGQYPVAVLVFQHRRVAGRRWEYADLFLVSAAKPKRTATPAQRVAIGKALAARRTCRRCARVRDYYLSTVSRLCRGCEDVTDFWADHARERGYEWPDAA